MRHLRFVTALVAALWGGGCMMQSQSAPTEMGPSSYGWALTITATPDVLPRDGSSQSTIRLNYRDGVSNAPLAGRRIVLATTAGSLSVGEVVTDSTGNASFLFTAPGPNTPVNTASVTALPVGDNIDNSVAQFVKVGLIGPEVPTASFTYTPSIPSVGSAMTFDASASRLGNSTCSTACSYAWDFGDGTSATGIMVQHTFNTAGVQNVTLTVVGPGGTSSSTTQSFAISAPAAPTAAFTVTPSNPTATQQAIFNASTSSVGAGATIVQYVWDFGDATAATVTVPIYQKTYAAAGTYIVTLTVRDSLSRTATVTSTVTVN